MSRYCQSCPDNCPVVSKALVAARLTELLGSPGLAALLRAGLVHQLVLSRAMGWLLAPSPELHTYTRAVGRPYSAEEKTAIATETYLVSESACPFWQDAGGGVCLLGGLATERQWTQEMRTPPPWGWLPTLVAAILDPRTLAQLVRDGLIPDAKFTLLNRRTDFPRPRWSTNQPYGAQGNSPEEHIEVVKDARTVRVGAD